MKKNFSIVIAGGIGIVIIILIVVLYNNQESEIVKIDELKVIETNFTDSIFPEFPNIQKQLDEIEKKAAENYYEPPSREW